MTSIKTEREAIKIASRKASDTGDAYIVYPTVTDDEETYGYAKRSDARQWTKPPYSMKVIYPEDRNKA